MNLKKWIAIFLCCASANQNAFAVEPTNNDNYYCSANLYDALKYNKPAFNTLIKNLYYNLKEMMQPNEVNAQTAVKPVSADGDFEIVLSKKDKKDLITIEKIKKNETESNNQIVLLLDKLVNITDGRYANNGKGQPIHMSLCYTENDPQKPKCSVYQNKKGLLMDNFIGEYNFSNLKLIDADNGNDNDKGKEKDLVLELARSIKNPPKDFSPHMVLARIKVLGEESLIGVNKAINKTNTYIANAHDKIMNIEKIKCRKGSDKNYIDVNAIDYFKGSEK